MTRHRPQRDESGRSRRTPLRAVRALALLILVAAPLMVRADGEPPPKLPNPMDEYQLKAEFLYRLASFIHWPESAWPVPGTPFNACVLGRNPFGKYLDRFDGRFVRGRRFAVRGVRSLDEGHACHLVFVGRDEMDDLGRLPRELGDTHVLSVGEGREFAERGGIISFVVANKRVGLIVNLTASREAGLTISSKLLDVAKIVEGRW